MIRPSGVSFSDIPTKAKVIKTRFDFPAVLVSDVVYFLDGVIDMADRALEVPASGLYLSGHNFDVSQLVSTVDNHTLFTSPIGGSGNLVCNDFSISVSGTDSKVYDLVGATGNEAFEFSAINYTNCTSRGEINNYRQGLETGVGFFGGKPELTMSGAWNGHRIDTSIVRGINDISALFKAGTGFTLSGRFITDINCDLPTTGALLDFSDTNIVNDESLVIQGAFITRNGVVNPEDAGITPNINESSVKSSWKGNTGLPNTTKYIKGVCSAEVPTTITAIDTYYPLLGTMTIERQTHFDSPANGQYRLLTGTGDYLITGDLTIEGTANNTIDIRVTRSTDDGASFTDVINHTKRVVNNLSGGRDVAFFQINFIANLNKNDRVRIEVENKTQGSTSVTLELDSYLIVSGL